VKDVISAKMDCLDFQNAKTVNVTGKDLSVRHVQGMEFAHVKMVLKETDVQDAKIIIMDFLFVKNATVILMALLTCNAMTMDNVDAKKVSLETNVMNVV